MREFSMRAQQKYPTRASTAPSFALRFDGLFNELGLTWDAAHAILQSHLLALRENQQTDIDATQTTATGGSERADTPAAKRPRARASLLDRRLNSDATNAEPSRAQIVNVLVERHRCLDRIGLHDLSMYYEHGSFNARMFWRDKKKLLPHLAILAARWLLASATSASAARVFL